MRAPPVGWREKGVLVEGVGVRGVVAWTCVRAEGQETEDGVWLGVGGYKRHF